MIDSKTYPHIDGFRGNDGESPATIAISAVIDPSPNYPDCARIIVGSPRSSESDIGGFGCGPEAARKLAAVLLQAADDVDTVLRAAGIGLTGKQ